MNAKKSPGVRRSKSRPNPRHKNLPPTSHPICTCSCHLPPPDPAFQFTLDKPRPRISDDTLITALREFGLSRGSRPFKMREFDAWPARPCLAQWIIHRFGSWSRALERAGFPGARQRNYDPGHLIHHLEKVWRNLGGPPSDRTLRDHGPISPVAYRNRWGSLRSACKQLARFKRGEITRAALLRQRTGARRPWLRPGLRWQVLERDRHRCRGCGRPAGEVKLEIDHIRPVSRGGSNDIQNLRALCYDCNRGRGAGNRTTRRTARAPRKRATHGAGRMAT